MFAVILLDQFSDWPWCNSRKNDITGNPSSGPHEYLYPNDCAMSTSSISECCRILDNLLHHVCFWSLDGICWHTFKENVDVVKGILLLNILKCCYALLPFSSYINATLIWSQKAKYNFSWQVGPMGDELDNMGYRAIAHKIDLRLSVAFPLLFLIFNGLYWTAVILCR